MKHQETITAQEYEYTAVFERAEEGGYVVYFPAVRGCVTQGETLEEARRMAADALQGHIECLIENSIELPTEKPVPEHSEPVKVLVARV